MLTISISSSASTFALSASEAIRSAQPSGSARPEAKRDQSTVEMDASLRWHDERTDSSPSWHDEDRGASLRWHDEHSDSNPSWHDEDRRASRRLCDETELSLNHPQRRSSCAG